MKAEFEYDSAEVVEMVLTEHFNTFGKEPDGYYWKAESYYSGVRIRLEKIEDKPIEDKPVEGEVADEL